MHKLLPKSASNPKGFTLVELLVVVSIIAVLSVIGIVIFGNVQIRARDARRTADLDNMSKAMEVAYTNGAYVALANSMFSSGVIPLDPRSNATYIIFTNGPGAAYKFCADLESVGPGTWVGNVQDRCVNNQQ